MLWIISGPSSVGKSTFITSPRRREITKTAPNTPVVFPWGTFRLDSGNEENYLLHYNILRPVDLDGRLKSPGIEDRDLITNLAIRFGRDLQWNEIIKRDISKAAIILVAPKQIILRRAKRRQIVESRALTKREESRYPSDFWSDIIERVNFPTLYKGWCDELRKHDIPYLVVNSSDATYPVVSSDEYETILS